MKRTLTLILSLCLFFSSYIPANAKTPDTLTTTYTEYLNDELYMEVTLSVSENVTDSKHIFLNLLLIHNPQQNKELLPKYAL